MEEMVIERDVAGSASERDTGSFAKWFIHDTHWSSVGVGLALGQFLLAPLVRRRTSRARCLAYLQLPVYMLHQYEEHGHGAFQRDVNRMLAAKGIHLGDRVIFWINMLAVWAADLLALALSSLVNPAVALAGPYLAIVNGLIHAGLAAKTRRYNPGLWTSLLLLLPFGVFSARAIGRDTGASAAAHRRALGVSVVGHVLVVLAIVATGRKR